MRKRELRLVVTFRTTTDAMAMEAACRDADAPGRLIPVPRSITAGCGLAWCAGTEDREILRGVMRQVRITEEAMHECMV